MIRIVVEAPRLPRAEQVLTPELERATTLVVALLEAAVAESFRSEVSRGATGAAASSIAGEVRVGESAGLGTVVGLVGSPLTHVQVINDGRLPGRRMPPVDAIELWVRRAGIAELPESRGVAFVIARSIARKGIEPRRFFEAAVEKNRASVEQAFADAGYQISVRMSGA